jgi:hypothetical protein
MSSEKEKAPPITLKMIAGRDSGGKDLEVLKGYSSTVVSQAFTEIKPVVLTGTEEGRAFDTQVVVGFELHQLFEAVDSFD